MGESWNDTFNGQFSKETQKFKTFTLTNVRCGKTYYQLCVILNDYRAGILETEEAADAIFRLLRGGE